MRDATLNTMAALPVLGVGASLSLDTTPDPATLVRLPGGPAFIEYAGRVSYEKVQRHVDAIRNAGAPVLFHPSFINFCGTFANDPRWLAETDRHVAATASPWFAQDVAYCFWGEQPGYSTQLGYFVPPILTAASLDVAVQRVKEVKAAVRVPVAIEPPPVTFALGDIPLLRFIGQLAERSDALILLDAGHVSAYARAAQTDAISALDEIPFERVVEVHVAGGRLTERGGHTFFLDAHEAPILDETWAVFDAILARAHQLRAVCIECEGVAQQNVMSLIADARARVLQHSPHEALRGVTQAQLAHA